MTRSTPSAFHGSSAGDLALTTLISLPFTTKHIVFGFVGGGFLGADFAFETTLGGVVFDEVSEVVGGNDIADGDDFDVFTDETLFDQRPENQAANAAEPINCDFNCHPASDVDARRVNQKPGWPKRKGFGWKQCTVFSKKLAASSQSRRPHASAPDQGRRSPTVMQLNAGTGKSNAQGCCAQCLLTICMIEALSIRHAHAKRAPASAASDPVP
jgi:hypothetical protein